MLLLALAAARPDALDASTRRLSAVRAAVGRELSARLAGVGFHVLVLTVLALDARSRAWMM
jgi:hypothetical protein